MRTVRTVLLTAALITVLLRTCEGEAQDEEKESSSAEKNRVERLFGGVGWDGTGGRSAVWPPLNVKACRPCNLPPGAMTPRIDPPLTSWESLKDNSTKWLLFFPRAGLGNTLRAFKSSYVFSLLSGRRLVVFIAGAHRRVLRELCQAFQCMEDTLRDDADQLIQRAIFKQLHPEILTFGEEHNMAQKLYSDVPILSVRSRVYFDKYWQRNSLLRVCLYRTLQCRTVRCVHVNAMRFLLKGGPRKVLEYTIQEFIEGKGKKKVSKGVPEGFGLRMSFDIAVHIRTRSSLVEGVELSEGCRLRGENCEAEREANRLQEERAEIGYLESHFWECSTKVFNGLRRMMATENDPEPILNIFLATDHETLRPTFVERLLEHGTIYYSVGAVSHSSRGVGSVLLPTMAEFYLLTRAPYVLEFMRPVSTFAEGAVDYGNATISFFEPQRRRICKFHFPFQSSDYPELGFIRRPR